MIDFLKKIWNSLTTFSLVEYTTKYGNVVHVVFGGEAISTIIVEGAGAVQIPKSLDN